MSQFCRNFKTSFSHKQIKYLVSIQRLALIPVSFIVTIREPCKSVFDGPFIFTENIYTRSLEYPLGAPDFSFINAMAAAVYKFYHENFCPVRLFN